MKIHKISAFTLNNKGGNEAGVVLTNIMPSKDEMLNIASGLGYSETAFLVKTKNKFRIRYFSPLEEVSFCGHATIASAAILAENFGEKEYKLILNDGEIKLNVKKDMDNYFATISSLSTYSEDLEEEYILRVLNEFNFSIEDIDKNFPIKIAFAGARHLILVLKDKKNVKNMSYHFDEIKELMKEKDLTTISILFKEDDKTFYSRNAFAFGGVYEDPATGAAALALGGYLRDIKFKKEGKIEILQGLDMNKASKLYVEFTEILESSVKVSGYTRRIEE